MGPDACYLLGRSGLRVGRLALATMNFGTSGFHAPYGKSEDDARAIFQRYVDAGGNSIDTADIESAGFDGDVIHMDHLPASRRTSSRS